MGRVVIDREGQEFSHGAHFGTYTKVVLVYLYYCSCIVNICSVIENNCSTKTTGIIIFNLETKVFDLETKISTQNHFDVPTPKPLGGTEMFSLKLIKSYFDA